MTLKFLLIGLMMIMLAGKLRALECVKNNDGEFEIQEDGGLIELESFDCMSITKPLETTVFVTYASDDDEGRQICQIHEDGVPKDKKIFMKSDVPTDMRCKYTCKDSSGLFKCTTKTNPNDNACICQAAPHRLIIERVISGISGQSEYEERMSCEGKQEGFQFPDSVPCSSLQADIHKRRVDFTGENEGKCNVLTSIKTETRYTEAAPNGLNLQGCLYVCKQAGPRCLEEEVDGKCECASPGLTKRLVPMEDLSLENVLRTSECTTDAQCSPCGKCNRETGDCELHAEAHTEERCTCGEICPEEDNRTANRRGQILCIPNVRLECMKKARWLRNVFDHFPVGTRYPNLCKEGSRDALDICSCAEDYVETPGPYSGLYCTHTNLISITNNDGRL